MKRLPRAVYTPEFREQAVRLYEESGLPLAEVAKQGKLQAVGRNQKPLNATELELAHTRRELAEAKLELDFLKKCAAYFAKVSR